MALDIGNKRIGLALKPKALKVILPLEAIERPRGRGENEVLDLIGEHSVETVIIGFPLNEEGRQTCQGLSVQRFCDRLLKRAAARGLKLNVRYVDEFATSIEAEGRLQEAAKGKKCNKYKRMVDSTAASIILERYLEQGQP